MDSNKLIHNKDYIDLKGRLLAVDPGDKRIGLAISDPAQISANPLVIIKHISREVDAAKILQIARLNQVVKIIIGQSMDPFGEPSLQGRKARRLAENIQSQSEITVELWDENESSQKAQQLLIELHVPRKKRKAPHDDLAAMMILQEYLDYQVTKIHQQNNVNL